MKHLLTNFFFLILVFSTIGCFRPSTISQPDALQKIVLDKSKKGVSHTTAVKGIYKLTDKAFISVSTDGQLLYWSFGGDGESYEIYKLPSAPDVVAYNNQSKYLAAVYHDHIDILSLSDNTPLYSLNRMRSVVLDCAFLSDGKSLLLAGADGRVYRWKFAEEQTAKTINDRQKSFEAYFGAATSVSAIAAHNEKRLFFTGDWEGGLSAWLTYDSDRLKGAYDANLFADQFFADEKKRAKSARTGAAVDQLEVTQDGNLLMLGSQLGEIEVWKVRGFKLGGSLLVHNGEIIALAVSPSGKYVASAGRDGKVFISSVHRLTDTELKEKDDRKEDFEIKVLKEYPYRARALLFLDDTNIIAGLESGDVLNIQTK